MQEIERLARLAAEEFIAANRATSTEVREQHRNNGAAANDALRKLKAKPSKA